MDQLDRWLALIEGPGHTREDRARALRAMQALGADALLPLLAGKLVDPELEIRYGAITAILLLDARRGVELVLPMLRDSEFAVRWHACGCLHDFGDERAIEALVGILREDPDPQMRSTAAYALGGIGSPAAIPALLQAMECDHERDIHGHSASSCAARALDDILGTNETRIRVSGSLCKLRPGPPDLERLKQLARKVYQDWSGSLGESGTAAGQLRD